MGVVVEFWSVPAEWRATAPDAVAGMEELRRVGRLVGDCSVNSDAVEEIFGALQGTALSMLLPSLSIESPGILFPATELENILSLLRPAPHPPADIIVHAMEDALEEAIWRETALAVVIE